MAETPAARLSYHAAAHAGDVPDGEPLQAKVAGRTIALYRVDGCFYATDDRCSHGLASLAMGLQDGHEIECPLHGGAFDVRTGKATRPPCVEAIEAFPVMQDGDALFVGLADED